MPKDALMFASPATKTPQRPGTLRLTTQSLGSDDLTRALVLKTLTNVEFVQGDVLHTIPAYLHQHPHFRIALLHVDVDVYRPSLTVLEHLVPRLVRGGLIFLGCADRSQAPVRPVIAT